MEISLTVWLRGILGGLILHLGLLLSVAVRFVPIRKQNGLLRTTLMSATATQMLLILLGGMFYPGLIRAKAAQIMPGVACACPAAAALP